MKNKFKIVVASAAILMCTGSQAQPGSGMDHKTIGGFYYAGLRTTPIFPFSGWEKAVGVYQSNVAPASYLEVNNNTGSHYLFLPPISQKEIFSTDAGGALGSFWRMKIAAAEKGVFYVDPALYGPNTFNMQATAGEMNVLTNQSGVPNIRMIVDDNATNGRMVIGDKIPPLFTPQSRLHIAMFGGGAPSDLRFTNALSGHALTDGFRIGITTAANVAGLAMLEPGGSMNFSTGGTSLTRVKIVDNGRTLIADNATLPLPGNRLEITSLGGFDPKPAGLRFTNLTATSPTEANPGVGILSVDLNGDVIYVPCCAPGGGGFGAYCPALNPLTGDYTTPFGGNKMYFEDQGLPNTNAMGIGYPCGSFLNAKFNVLQQNPSPISVSTIAGSLINSDVLTPGVAGTFRGLLAVCNGVHPGGNITNIAGDFRVTGAPVNTGVRSVASFNNAFNKGGDFSASGTGATNYGIYASVSGSYPTDVAGYFVGDVFCTTNNYLPSDKNYKKDIKKIENSLDIVSKLNPVTYFFDKEKEKDINLANDKQYGFISQEIKEILPEFTRTVIHPASYDAEGKMISDKKEILALNYNGFIAILAKAIQEQQKQINELKAAQNTGNTGGRTANISKVELNDKSSIILDQNVPNPFAEQTSIHYSLTDGVKKAQILFYNIEGRLINTAELNPVAGDGQLNVIANDLSNGIYTYTMIVDGKVIDSKKMIKEK